MTKRSWALLAAGVGAAAILPAAAASAGGSCAGYDGERVTDSKGDTVLMEGNCFGPTVLRVAIGDKVTFVNKDPYAHTVGGTAGSFGDMHRAIAPGRSVRFQFKKEGIFPYVCLFHPGMAGAIVVGDGTPPARVAADAPVATQASTRPQGRPKADADREEGGTNGARVLATASLVLLGAGVTGLALRSRRTEPKIKPEGA